ncbi:MAG TPA: tRNA lysidine(34) synthetase TilS [Chitinophagales bacterium]|nr:tRNA lysidine(34) synthetase TilS [Chitinophagales bacterium]
MIKELQQYIIQELQPHIGKSFLLAVSGGLDSVVMANLFKTSTFKFGIIHCNFQLRGNDSDADSEFVKALAKKFDVSFFCKKFETEQYAIENKLSIEEAARNLRYQWFEEIRNAFHYDYIITAHHANDNLETTLLHFIKGSGIHGMQGIPQRNGNIIRPLLKVSRDSLQSFAEKNNIAYCTDLTNVLNEYTRNKIRNTVVPILKEINPTLENTFVQTNQNLIEAAIIVKDFLSKKIKNLKVIKGDNIFFSIATLNALAYKRSLLFQLLNPYNFSAEQVIEISNNLFGSGKIFLSSTHRIIIDRKFLIITEVSTNESPLYFIYENTKSISVGNKSFEIDFIKNKPNACKPGNTIACFDMRNITYPITVRKWKRGDYLYPVGMKKANGNPARKKISDLFTDAKYSLLEKENTWILLCDEKVIWVSGLRQDYRFASKENSALILKIKMHSK